LVHSSAWFDATIGAEAVYGFWFSTALVTISSTVGAAVNFLTSRYLARSWMRTAGSQCKISRFDKAGQHEVPRMILISRMSPIIPHSLVSYAAGLIRISFWRFTLRPLSDFPAKRGIYYLGAVVEELSEPARE
jgi:uncharacterized membrane protein YdjX (TVP38/TMEM64 family)